MENLYILLENSGLYQLDFGSGSMILVGLLLLFLAIVKKFEPLLLLPIGFGAILSNIPGAGLALSAVGSAIYAADPEVLSALANSLNLASWGSASDIYDAFKESSSASILTLSMDTSTSSSVSPEMSTEDTSERFSISSCRYSAYSLSLSSS